MEKEKLFRPQEILIIALIFGLIISILGTIYLNFQKNKDKISFIWEKIKISFQQESQQENLILSSEPKSKIATTSDWETYYSQRFGFEFKYPKNWQLSVSESTYHDFIHLFSEHNEKDRLLPDEERKYAVLLMEVYYLKTSSEDFFYSPFYPDCPLWNDSLFLNTAPLEDRLFCRCSHFKIIDIDNNPYKIKDKNQIRKTTINGMKAAICEYTLFDVLIHDNILIMITFFRPNAPEFVNKFDDTVYEIIYSLKEINF